MLPFWIFLKKTYFFCTSERKGLLKLLTLWKGYLCQDEHMKRSGRGRFLSEKVSQWAIAFKTLKLCSWRLQNQLKMKPYHLNFSAFTAEFFTTLMLTTHYGMNQSVKYFALCFTKYWCSRFVKGGKQVIAFNLCIVAKPYWIILLLEALETNSKKNHRVWKHILGYIISITV